MWDLIVSVPDHCLSFFTLLFRICRTDFAQFLPRSVTFFVVDADWLNALRRFPIS